VYQRDCDTTRNVLVNGECIFWKTHPKFIFLQRPDCVLCSALLARSLHSPIRISTSKAFNRKVRKDNPQRTQRGPPILEVTKDDRRTVGEHSIGNGIVAGTSRAKSQEPTTNDRFPQKIMRSGPATRTAFTSVNLASAVSALSAGFVFTLCSGWASPVSAAERCFRTQGAFASQSCSAVCGPAMRDRF